MWRKSIIPADSSQSGGRFRKSGKYLRDMFMRRLWEKR